MAGNMYSAAQREERARKYAVAEATDAIMDAIEAGGSRERLYAALEALAVVLLHQAAGRSEGREL